MPKKEPELRLPPRPRDATNTGGLRKSYQTKLWDLYKEYDERLLLRTGRLLNRTTEESGFLKEFSDKIDETESMVLKAKTPKIIQEHVTRAYTRGKDVAANNPRLRQQSIIIDSRLSRTDNLMIEDLKTRNFNLINDDSIKKTLLRVITEDIRTGEGVEKMVRDIHNSITDIGRSRAKMIARTEMSFSYNTAVAKTYRDAGIERWQWFSALIDTTCMECSSRHGDVFDWGDEQPPLHPNCFCSIYPVVDREFKR